MLLSLPNTCPCRELNFESWNLIASAKFGHRSSQLCQNPSSVGAGPMSMERKAIVVVALLALLKLATPAVALKVNTTVTKCSSVCESEHCVDPFNLRYGKYCGIGYSGCDGQGPCDGIDSCCFTHDNCIGSNLQNYVNRTCNNALKDCIKQFKAANLTQFAGSNCSAVEVENVIIASMDTVTLDNGSGDPPLINLHWIEALVSILSVILVFGW